MSAEGTLGWESCQRNKQINVAQLMWITFPQGTLGFSWVYAMSSEIWRSSGEKKDMFGCNSKVGHVKRLYWPQKYTNSLHSIKYPCLYIFLECQKMDKWNIWIYYQLWPAIMYLTRQKTLKVHVFFCAPKPLVRLKWATKLLNYTNWI